MKGKLLIKKVAITMSIALLLVVQTGGAYAEEDGAVSTAEETGESSPATASSTSSQETQSTNESTASGGNSGTASLASGGVSAATSAISSEGAADTKISLDEADSNGSHTITSSDSADQSGSIIADSSSEETITSDSSIESGEVNNEVNDSVNHISSDDAGSNDTADSDKDNSISDSSSSDSSTTPETPSSDKKPSTDTSKDTASDSSDKKDTASSTKEPTKDTSKDTIVDDKASEDASGSKTSSTDTNHESSKDTSSNAASGSSSSGSGSSSSSASDSSSSKDTASSSSGSTTERSESSSLSSTPSFNDTSLERYQKYKEYSKKVSSELQKRINELTIDYNAKVELLASFLAKTGSEYKVMRMTPVYLDDSGQKVKKGTDGAIQKYTPKEIKDDTVSIDNWGDILAVFVARSSLNVDEPLDLLNLQQIDWSDLENILYEMNTITYTFDENNKLELLINSYSYSDKAITKKMKKEQIASLEELMQPEFQSVFASVTGNKMFTNLSDAEIAKLKSALPDELNLKDNSIVDTALSLVGKVNYFWGGKYSQIGMNPEWGSSKEVTASGSSSTGSSRSYGLDCSGYVTWVYINASKNVAMGSAVGDGTADQWSKSYSVGWDQAQLGDLAFLKVPGNGINHVGIIVAVNDDGSYSVAHCSSSSNNVVVTEAWATGFRYIRRPYVLG